MERSVNSVFLVLAVALSVFVSAAPQYDTTRSVTRPQAIEPAHVAITGADCVFVQLPSTLAAGPTLFSAVVDSLIGILIARPGEGSGGQLYADLISGRSYIVVCMLKDTPSSRPHTDLGMIGTFRVR